MVYGIFFRVPLDFFQEKPTIVGVVRHRNHSYSLESWPRCFSLLGPTGVNQNQQELFALFFFLLPCSQQFSYPVQCACLSPQKYQNAWCVIAGAAQCVITGPPIALSYLTIELKPDESLRLSNLGVQFFILLMKKRWPTEDQMTLLRLPRYAS